MRRAIRIWAVVAIMILCGSVTVWGQQYGIQVATGAAAVSSTLDVASGREGVLLVGFTLNLSAAPVASENFTVTLDATDGAAYDTVLYSRDLSSGSVTDVLYQFEPAVFLKQGDKAVAAWTNTDTRTYALRWIYRRAN